MLVLSRKQEESIFIGDSGGECVLTVLHLQSGEVSLLVSQSSVEKPGELDTWKTKLVRNTSFKIGNTTEVTLVDIREEKARIGINTAKSANVHRLEVLEAIRGEQRRTSDGDAEDDPSGAPVPRPGGPKPPSLDVRLNEPPPADGGDA